MIRIIILLLLLKPISLYAEIIRLKCDPLSGIRSQYNGFKREDSQDSISDVIMDVDIDTKKQIITVNTLEYSIVNIKEFGGGIGNDPFVSAIRVASASTFLISITRFGGNIIMTYTRHSLDPWAVSGFVLQSRCQ